MEARNMVFKLHHFEELPEYVESAICSRCKKDLKKDVRIVEYWNVNYPCSSDEEKLKRFFGRKLTKKELISLTLCDECGHNLVTEFDGDMFVLNDLTCRWRNGILKQK